MLSIAAMKNSQGDYYLGLVRQSHEDYYLSGGEPPGQWLGSGTTALNIVGTVQAEHLKSLLAGLHPQTQTPLIQNAGKAKRQVGWDLTFSAPKSVSVLWSQSDPTTRALLENVHDRAVRAALAYLEDAAGVTRRGKGGAIREPAGLVIATFAHGTSRAQDPQIHTHCLVLNLGVRRDGTTGTIASKAIYLHKMAAGALYRAELAAALTQQFGLSIVPQRTGFEVAGVPDALCAALSKRRQEIEREMLARGVTGAKAAAVATLHTRQAKEGIPRSVLFERWHAQGHAHGFTDVEVRNLLYQKRPARDVLQDTEDALRTALERITEQSSHFAERDLVRHLADIVPWLGADAVRQVVRTHVHSEEVVALGQERGEVRYTTPETLKTEADMLACAQRLHTNTFRGLNPRTVQSIVDALATLSQEQQAAIRHLTLTAGSLHLMSGRAGTGKTFVLAAVRRCFEQAGFVVQGAALSARAAQELEAGANISSQTLHRLLHQLDYDAQAAERDAHPGTQRAASERSAQVGLSVIVIDEAGMVGTRQLARLLLAAERTGHHVILVGDCRQLQPIEAGGPFAALSEQLGQAELTAVIRQREEWARSAVSSFAEGQARQGLAAFEEHGLLHVAEGRHEAVDRLIADWRAEGTVLLHERLIVATTNPEVVLLNLRAQHALKEDGALKGLPVAVGAYRLYINDRILLTRNCPLYGIFNGTFGTVLATDPLQQTVTVKMDSGLIVTLPVAEYPYIQLGYATTAHKAQGMTVEQAFVLLGGDMQDQELSYVQVSRARDQTRLYVDAAAAGDDLADLARQMDTSHRKGLAHDLLPPVPSPTRSPAPSLALSRR